VGVGALAADLALEERADAEVRVFDSDHDRADAAALEVLRAGVAGADLAAPAVVLPDFHHKGDKEMPSSITIATRETVRPIFTAPSVNCGMALVTLDVDRPTTAAITDFYSSVRERFPYPTTNRRDLTADEVIRAATEGSHFAVDRFGIDPAELERVEEGGHLDVERFGGADRVRRELPWSVLQLSRIRFATIGPSNHFIELQEVDDVFDAHAAELLGVSRGQITMQYHGGGGSLPGEVGLLFGRRKRYPRAVRAQMAVQKPLYHLGRARSLEELRTRLRLYFSAAYPPVPRDSDAGERLMLMNTMAMNYGFAFRLAASTHLRALLATSFGVRDARLVVDSPHNSIYEEDVDGAPALVHRHNTARAYSAERMAAHPLYSKLGQPILLPGTNRTSSYLCVAGSAAGRSLYSACHGAGSTIKRFATSGRSGPDPRGRATLRYDYKGAGPLEVPQLDDAGIDEALTVLVRNGIVRPVARLRPFAVLN
jgi:tRNA-splicing ligase RtcB (3'-phosphate/5'-hydroxy nucleic acid ligase)